MAIGDPLSSRPPAFLQSRRRLAGVPMFPCSLVPSRSMTSERSRRGQLYSVTKGGPFGRGTGDQGNRRGKGPDVGPGSSQRRARPHVREWGWLMTGRTMGCEQPRFDHAQRRCRLPARAPSLPALLDASPRQGRSRRSPPIRISLRGRLDGSDVRRGLSNRMAAGQIASRAFRSLKSGGSTGPGWRGERERCVAPSAGARLARRQPLA